MLARALQDGLMNVVGFCFIFCPMKCLLLRRHHERYRLNLAVKHRLILTISSRAIEGIETKTQSIRWSKGLNISQPRRRKIRIPYGAEM